MVKKLKRFLFRPISHLSTKFHNNLSTDNVEVYAQTVYNYKDQMKRIHSFINLFIASEEEGL